VLDEANDILGLMMRHWNGIAATLHKGDVHLPILLEDEMACARAATGLAGSCAVWTSQCS
jgi:hypothetical protein